MAYNPQGFTDSCVFVALARLLRTTPEQISDTSEWLTGNMRKDEVVMMLQFLGREFEQQDDLSEPRRPTSRRSASCIRGRTAAGTASTTRCRTGSGARCSWTIRIRAAGGC
ncbi:hypothetical protein PG990_004541 [Apiospora arundinis]